MTIQAEAVNDENEDEKREKNCKVTSEKEGLLGKTMNLNTCEMNAKT